jgi:DNA repair protein RecO (recombination protein O)
MLIRTTAIVCAVRAHGEHGAIARLLTPEDGLQAGYVRGGHARAMRPVLLPGNLVAAEFRARSAEQLAGLTVELVRSRAGLFAEPLPAAAIEWVTALTAVTLPEGQSYPHLHSALDGVLAAIEAAPSARGWAGALVRYELLLLSELGFGLDLSSCAASGASEDLGWVSPKSGQAVSRAAGAAYADKLLPLPSFLLNGGEAEWGDIRDALRLTGFFLDRDLLAGPRASVLDARDRLAARIRRLAGG